MICKDCAAPLDPQELRNFKILSSDSAEGLCDLCFRMRFAEGECIEDLIAEFCG